MSREFIPGTRVYFGNNDGRNFPVLRQVGTEKLELLISSGKAGAKTRIVHVANDEVRTAPASVACLDTLRALRLPNGFRPR